ncbi:MAG: AbrB/MazE/SpoVT family DNA-binding domain-containing protein [Candidatus Firestonebacteria bacterium]
MKANIIPIGNSRGIRIPKTLFEQCHIGKIVELEIKGKNIVIKPIKQKPRKNWDEAFLKMHENKDDQLIIDDNIDLDTEDWEWK